MKSAIEVSASSRPRPMTTRWSAVSAISLIRWLETKTVRPSRGQPLHQVADPVDALGVEAVDRLVEQQDLAGRRAARRRCRAAGPCPARSPWTASWPRRSARPSPAPRPPGAAGCRWSARGTAGGCRRCGRRARPWRPAARRCLAAARAAARRACRRCAPRQRSGCPGPSIIRIVVDLPAPFGPRKPVTTPGRTVKVRSSTAVLSPYRLVSPCSSIMAARLASTTEPPPEEGRGFRAVTGGPHRQSPGQVAGRRAVSGTAVRARPARSARPRPARRRRRPPHRSAWPASRGRWSAGR